MSLGIVFKGPEGIVLAADSRVTLMTQMSDGSGSTTTLPATFDNATKLLRAASQPHIGVVTYGLGTIGIKNPRTAHSYLPELDKEFSKTKHAEMRVRDFAEKLSQFFMNRWKEEKMPSSGEIPDMTFLIAGYEKKEAYGAVYQVNIPSQKDPIEMHPGNQFGLIWGGQTEFVARLIKGLDPTVIPILSEFLKLSSDQSKSLQVALSGIEVKIPYQFLPLQDCINLSILLIQTTIAMQSFYVGLRGVGGEIDVATITRTMGYQAYREKALAKFFSGKRSL